MNTHTPAKEYRTLGCGCCNDGCCCWMHKPYMRSEPTVCAYHAQYGHPQTTGIEDRALARHERELRAQAHAIAADAVFHTAGAA